MLEGLTEVRKAVILTVTVYYSKRIHIKITNGKRPSVCKAELESHGEYMQSVFVEWGSFGVQVRGLVVEEAGE